jgi:ankyrin repeat protein
LLLAASASAEEIVAKLLAARVEKDAQNEFGDTALIIASRNGNTALVRQLLKSGASTRLRNKNRASAADVAKARAFTGIVALLAEA